MTLTCATPAPPDSPDVGAAPPAPIALAPPERPVQSAPGPQAEQPVERRAAQPDVAPPAPPTAAPAVPTAAPRAVIMPAPADPIDLLLDRMTIEQKVGQRFITWVPGTATSPRAAALIRLAHVGGVIINSDNVDSYDQVARLIDDLQRMAQATDPPVPLFIATDQEGGRVSRVRLPELTRFPAAFHWGVHGEVAYVEAAAYVTGVELRRIGITMNLAPVLDLYGPPDRTVIGDRAFAAEPALVADFARAYVRGADRAGVIAVAKHFPGHGVTTIDSHTRLPVVRLTRSDRSSILAPFIAAIDAGIDAIMTAHILYEDLDPSLPATVSRSIVSDLLRDELGFDGMVITDTIEMEAPPPQLTDRDIVRHSFAAGVDIILAARDRDVLPLVQEGIRLVRSGVESEERLDASVRRILRVKQEMAGLQKAAR